MTLPSGGMLGGAGMLLQNMSGGGPGGPGGPSGQGGNTLSTANLDIGNNVSSMDG